MIEIVLMIACLLIIIYYFNYRRFEGFDENTESSEGTENTEGDALTSIKPNDNPIGSDSSSLKPNDNPIGSDPSSRKPVDSFINDLTRLLTNFKENNNIQSYVYDHTTKQDNVIIFYGKDNSNAQITKDDSLKITVNYGSGKKETYDYEKVYDKQILFTDPTNSKNSAVLQKTDNSMTLTVYSNDQEYLFYPDISNNRDTLVNYINEQYYDDTKIDKTKSTSSEITSSSKSSKSSKRSTDDLYILKSEIVPPVCPVCPTPITINECSSKPVSKTPEPNPLMNTLNNTMKTIESDFTKYTQPTKSQDVSQNAMLLPVQNYFVNDPTLALNGKAESTNEPMPMLNSFASFG